MNTLKPIYCTATFTIEQLCDIQLALKTQLNSELSTLRILLNTATNQVEFTDAQLNISDVIEKYKGLIESVDEAIRGPITEPEDC